MHKKHFLSSLFFFCCYLQIYAQLCEGSLGDPIVEIDFGSGTERGSALGSAITAFNYVGSGTLDEGEYTIFNTTSGLKENPWHITTDHTGNENGYMMVINSDVLADEGVFYTKTVNGLCSDTTYEFSAWVMNIMNPANGTDEHNPNITFRISDTAGNILGSYSTGNIAQTSSATWIQYGLFFNLDSDTEVVITILNSAASGRGNDITLDDIAFRACGPTIINSIDNEDTSNLSVCQNENVNFEFQASVSAGYSDPQYQWQSSNDNGTTWVDLSGENTTNYLFTNTSTAGNFLYRLTAANGSNINTLSCRITSDNFNVEIIETPDALTGEAEQTFCITENATIANIIVSDTAIWYDGITNGNVLSNADGLADGTTYYAAKETISGCESDDRTPVLVSIIEPSLIVNNISSVVCDDLNDSEEIIDLTSYESEITICNDCIYSYFTTQTDAENDSDVDKIELPTSFNWSTDFPIIYVRIESTDNCYQIAQIAISIQDSPIISISDSMGICEGDNDIIIDAGTGFDNYLWSTGETTESITVATKNTGDYWVTVTEDHTDFSCSSTKEFTVLLSNTAIISDIIIEDWTDSNNTITIILDSQSLGSYEYSLDDISYQDSNIFTNLTPGEYTIYVRDNNGCGTIIEQAYILNAPKYFTPNNDGYHDTWSIKYAEIEPNLEVKIYDRYGKLIKSLNATSSWDGTFNGQNMPTSDYWFVVTRNDGKNYTGHFTLKR